MDDTQYFIVDVAVELGVVPAIVFDIVLDKYVEAEGGETKVKYHDGDVWVKCPISELAAEMPYTSGKKIGKSLRELRKHGYLRATNLNTDSFDRTLWYTPTEYGKDLWLTSAENR